jgi:hypothetical protein
MSRTTIDLALSATQFRPGGTLNGRFRILPHLPADTTSVELSVLWLTNRKRSLGVDGYGQIGVVVYQTWTVGRGALADLAEEHPFAFPLPVAPWTHAGMLVRIDWLVRIRLRFGSTGEEVREVGFALTPPGR